MEFFSLIKNILAPIKCYSCRKEWHFICKDCEFRLRDYESSCFVCKQNTENFEIHKTCKNDAIYYDKIIIRYHYRWYYVSKMVKDGKFYHKKDVLHYFWIKLREILEEHHKIDEGAILVPVPLHFFRKIKRGYNQSDIIAKNFSKVSFLSYHNWLLYRKKITRQQSKLSKNIRKENIKNCFGIKHKLVDMVDKKQIIIVDDVVSTWSTVNELAKLLKEHGAREVVVVCIASD